MRRWLLILLTAALLGLPISAQRFSKCNSCQRDGRTGRIVRSAQARRDFIRTHPCPSFNAGKGCRGYQVDHKLALACGGRDVAGNMQWLTVAEHRAKTRRDAQCRK